MSTIARKVSRAILVPVTTMEEIEELTAEERAGLLTSLGSAERELSAGRGAPYDGEELEARLLKDFQAGKSE